MQRRLQVTRQPYRPRRRGFRVFLAAVCCVALHCGQDPAERRATIYDLRASPSAENVGAIRALLEDPDRDVRATALNALVGLQVPDSATLAVGRLEDPDGFVRATAAKLVAEVGSAEHAPLLVNLLLRDPDPIARQRAAEALSVLGGDAALAGLGSGLADPMQAVRQACVAGLRRVDPAFAKGPLAQLLREDPAWEIRAQAARTLGLVPDPQIAPLLEAALEDPNEFVRSAAANALRSRTALGERSAP